MNSELRLAAPPVYSQDGTVGTIHLKHYLWSGGEPVTSKNMLVWINLLRANIANWAPKLPGGFPANIKSAVTQDPATILLTLIHRLSPEWFTGTQPPFPSLPACPDPGGSRDPA